MSKNAYTPIPPLRLPLGVDPSDVFVEKNPVVVSSQPPPGVSDGEARKILEREYGSAVPSHHLKNATTS